MSSPLSSALSTFFAPAVRERGASYAASGAAAILHGSPTEVRAKVRTEDTCAVSITRAAEGARARFDVLCTCADFYARLEPCEHVWATLVTAESHGFLQGDPARSLDPGHLIVRPINPMTTSQADADSRPAGFLANVTERLALRDSQREARYPYADSTLFYVIDALASATPTVTLRLMHQRRTRAGSVDKPKPAPHTPGDIMLASASDRRLLSLLAGAVPRAADADAAMSTFVLPQALALELLPPIARTARAWLRSRGDSSALLPLAWDDGNAWRQRLKIEETRDGARLTGELCRDDTVVPFTEPFVILAEGLVALRGKLARFDADDSLPLFLELQAAGGTTLVPHSALSSLAEVLATTDAPVRDVPATLAVSRVRVTPVPRLSVHRIAHGAGTLSARLAFDYDGVVASSLGSRPLFDADRRRLMEREVDAERRAAERLREIGFYEETSADGDLAIEPDEFSDAARRLLDEGWDIRAEGVRYRAARRVRLSVRSGIDWFDLVATVNFGGFEAPLADLLASLRRDGPMVKLGDGSMGLLPEEWLERFGTLTSTGQIVDGHVRFRASQTALLDALLADREDEADITVDAVFERARRELATFATPVPIDAAPSFTGVLRPYQREGLGWFDFLRRFGFGGCLADDMGLGKTIMVLALVDSRRHAAEGRPHKPSLIVVPRSLVGNWLSEAGKFAPAMRMLDHSRGGRETTATAFAGHDAVLVTYGTLRRDIEALSQVEFDYVVLDEAQMVKNASTASAKAARLLKADHRLALSGTPIENHLGELWSVFEFLNPGILGRSSIFQRAITDSATDRDMAALLSRGLRPFILRRTKQQVARELPARTEQTIFCDLLPKDRRLYDGLRRHYRSAVLERVDRDGVGKSRMHVLEALLRLRQAACHTGLIDRARASESSAKFDVLVPYLQQVVAEGHKAIVFSQFTTLLGLLRVQLDGLKLQYEYLDGKTRDRSARVQRFQEDPAIGLFLISLKAGGLGLNLTAAEYVFLLDPWWNPAVEAQAIDRAHRIGQTREVFAYRVIAKDTVEEKVLDLQQSKRSLADAVLEGDALGLRHLSRDDLDLLLS